MLTIFRKSLFIKGRVRLILMMLAIQVSFFLSLIPVLDRYQHHLSLLAYAQVPSNQVEFYADVFEKYVSSQEVINPGYSLDLDMPHVIELAFKNPHARDALKADVPEIQLTAYKDQDRAFLMIHWAQGILGGVAVLAFILFCGVLLTNRFSFLRVFSVVDQLGIPVGYLKRIFVRETMVLAVVSSVLGCILGVVLTVAFSEVTFLSLFKGEQILYFLGVPFSCMVGVSFMTYLTSCFR